MYLLIPNFHFIASFSPSLQMSVTNGCGNKETKWGTNRPKETEANEAIFFSFYTQNHINFDRQPTENTPSATLLFRYVWSFLPHSLSLIRHSSRNTFSWEKIYKRWEFLKQFYQFWSGFKYSYILTWNLTIIFTFLYFFY